MTPLAASSSSEHRTGCVFVLRPGERRPWLAETCDRNYVGEHLASPQTPAPFRKVRSSGWWPCGDATAHLGQAVVSADEVPPALHPPGGTGVLPHPRLRWVRG